MSILSVFHDGVPGVVQLYLQLLVLGEGMVEWLAPPHEGLGLTVHKKAVVFVPASQEVFW